MKIYKPALATAELLVIFPAVLFMTALLLRSVQPPQYEPAHSAQQIVNWYAARPRIGLWAFLIGFPLIVLITGGAKLWREWSRDVELRQATRQIVFLFRRHVSMAVIAGATLMAGGVLAIVALHLLAD